MITLKYIHIKLSIKIIIKIMQDMSSVFVYYIYVEQIVKINDVILY